MNARVPPEGVPLTVDDARVDQISGEVAALRRHLDETLDRLDFTERMLAQAQARGVLGAPKGS